MLSLDILLYAKKRKSTVLFAQMLVHDRDDRFFVWMWYL